MSLCFCGWDDKCLWLQTSDSLDLKLKQFPPYLTKIHAGQFHTLKKSHWQVCPARWVCVRACVTVCFSRIIYFGRDHLGLESQFDGFSPSLKCLFIQKWKICCFLLCKFLLFIQITLACCDLKKEFLLEIFKFVFFFEFLENIMSKQNEVNHDIFGWAIS